MLSKIIIVHTKQPSLEINLPLHHDVARIPRAVGPLLGCLWVLINFWRWTTTAERERERDVGIKGNVSPPEISYDWCSLSAALPRAVLVITPYRVLQWLSGSRFLVGTDNISLLTFLKQYLLRFFVAFQWWKTTPEKWSLRYRK